MHTLIFRGNVSSGIGRHSQLRVPGRGALPQAPVDWPLSLHPGSLNVRIALFPPELKEHGLAEQVSELDRGLFLPVFEILQSEFGNNKLDPTSQMPKRGSAQVWRAKLETEEDEINECWVLRRFGSTVGNQLELVASRKLRDEGLSDNQQVSVVMSGRWHHEA